MPELARDLAAYAVGLSAADIPPDVAGTVSRAIADTVGVALSGYPERCALAAREVISTDPALPASIWGQGERHGSAADAAWANGMAAHALDFDDYIESCFCHPSVVLLPAVLALAEQYDAPGTAALAGYVAGYEVMSAIGAGLGGRHYARGFHATGTLGALGATVASAKVLGLGTEQTTMAIAIACSGAAGLRSNVGTDSKPMHAAQAAAGGVRAAELAARGFTGSPDALDGPHGLISVMGGETSAAVDGSRRLAETWYLRTAPPTVKLYPSCGMTHSAIAAGLAIRREHHDLACHPNKVVVRMPPQAAWPLRYHDPQTGLQAKFCLEYVIAIALLDGAVNVGHFRDEAVRRLDVQKLMSRVELVSDVSYGEIVARQGSYPMAVTVHGPGSQGAATEEVLDGPGSARNPVTTGQLLHKFRTSVPGLTEDEAGRLWRRLLALPDARTVRGVLNMMVTDNDESVTYR